MKKKGLIVATIVMVLVLAVSLTTATYAWFSTQAEATIEGVSITTTSTEGLQIGVKTTNTAAHSSGYTYGQISYNKADNFTGEGDGWGVLADFSSLKTSLGTVEDAVTLVTADEITHSVYTGKVFKKATAFVAGTVYYINTDTGLMTLTATDAVEDGDVTYYEPDTFEEGDYLVPLAYNAMIEPTCFAKAVANGDGSDKSADYLVLPIGVRATMDVTIILCTITITPDTANIANNQFVPGMAAACYITLDDGTTSITVEAYPQVTKGASAATGTGVNEPTWTYSFVVLGDSTGTVSALTAKDITYTIWVEGEDDMCDNLTAGSGFEVDIDYKYEEGTTNLSKSGSVITVADDTVNEGDYNIIFTA